MNEHMATAQTPLSEQLDKLMIRVYDRLSLPHPEITVWIPIGEHLAGTLVVDGAGAMISVSKEEAEKANKTVDELLSIAKQNLWKRTQPEMTRNDFPDGQLTFIQEPFFGASQITILEKYTEVGETYFVSTPGRDLLMMFKPKVADMASLAKFLSVAGRMFDSDATHPILPFVLQYRDGILKDLCRTEGNRIIPDETLLGS